MPSGLAAIATVSLALLRTGDEVLVPDNVYGPNKTLTEGELAHFGIGHQYYDPMSVEDLAAKITPATKLVWLEAPGSVTMEFPNLVEQVRLCRARGVTMVLDNTWGAGLAFRPFDLLGDGSLGVDVTAHALTKYPSGGGDVLMGSIITRNQPLHMRIKLAHMRLGLGVSGNDAEAVLRSLPSIGLRYHAQDRSARRLAQWLVPTVRWRRSCTPPCLTPRAMLTGSSCAHKARTRMAWLPVCSAWSSTNVLTRRPWTASATACACSSWATAGAGR